MKSWIGALSFMAAFATASAGGDLPMRTAAALQASAVLATPATAAQRQAVLPALEQLVKAAFPELAQRRLWVDIWAQTMFDAPWTAVYSVTVTIPDPFERSTDPRMQAEQSLLTGSFHMTDGIIEQASFSGKELWTKEWRALNEKFKSRAKWSDAELRSALKEAGAKYAPEHQVAFERQLPLDRLAAIIGNVTTKTVTFNRGFQSDDADVPDDVLARWVVDLKTRRNEKTGCYRLSFDPLTGRMTTFHVLECP